MVQEDSRSRMQAHAQLKYNNAMAHMKKLSMQYAAMEKVYDARAAKAAKHDKELGKQERSQMHQLAKQHPILGMESTSGKLVKSVQDALQHREVQQLEKDVIKEHEKIQASNDPFAGLKAQVQELDSEEEKDAESVRKWKALRYGYSELIPPKPDEAVIQAKAHKIFQQSEKELGHRLNKEQKKKILEATRVYEANKLEIGAARKRLDAVTKLSTQEARSAKKRLAKSEAEEIFSENDAQTAAMAYKVQQAKVEAKDAIAMEERIASGE